VRAEATVTARRPAEARETGLLIVNADDWGHDERTTDAIERCFGAGRVTSVSAMVGMADSARAAEAARHADVPAGLHLNLIERFSDPSLPDFVREHQDTVVGWFERGGWTRWTYNPRIRRALAETVDWQLGAFRDLYGREPTHVDGHRHVHTAPNMLLSRALPEGLPVRSSFTFQSGEKSPLNRSVRELVNRTLARRHPTTRYFFSIRMLHPRLGGGGMAAKLGLAAREPVEIMCHPGWDDEYGLLMSREWEATIAGLRLGSFADLERR
jgi:chitin disaccharide deacetylase